MAKHKVQAYDVSEEAKKRIVKLCADEQRSESFIVSRILNKMFDPIQQRNSGHATNLDSNKMVA